MNTKTQAIVLSKIKYSDASYIVNLFTEKLGKVAVFVRISNSKAKDKVKPALFFPLNIVEIELNLKTTRNIQTLKYCNFVETINNICTDVYKASVAQFIAEVILKTLKDEQTDMIFYDYLKSIILQLNKQTGLTQNMHLVFLKEYAKILGFQITNNHSELTPYFNLREGMFLPSYTTVEESLDIELSSVLSDLLTINLNSLGQFNVNYAIRKKLLASLILYYGLHIENLPEIKSLKVLNEVFTA
ncbi:MAG: DNA repair protein RecO [Bacteroidales bacterium]|nr:DNA repair protein RecO [Bacteroidales bacterium]MDD4215812.1 DNA repair protein RecO [Bacteroidales bacterium]MDY0142770.1 DNA repair protein RecO [Bacteroidales bacterium]